MKKVLVIGGTRFFGKKLVETLLKKGAAVTVMTRGRAEDPFGSRIERIYADRSNPEEMQKAAEGRSWDVIYDQICYSPDEAKAACDVFRGKTGRYIFTSTLSVYDLQDSPLKEEDFNPYTYPLRAGDRESFTYQEGKRQAEAIYFQEAGFPVVAVRLPIVMGTDDYTKRLLFHIEHVKEGRTIGMPNKKAEMGFISAEEAGDFLAWAGSQDFTGPINACADGEISLENLLGVIEQKTGCQAEVLESTDERDMSPYGIEQSWYMDNTKAKQAGYSFSRLTDWLPELVQALANTPV